MLIGRDGQFGPARVRVRYRELMANPNYRLLGPVEKYSRVFELRDPRPMCRRGSTGYGLNTAAARCLREPPFWPSAS